MGLRIVLYPALLILLLIAGAVLLLNWERQDKRVVRAVPPLQLDVKEPARIAKALLEGKKLHDRYCERCHGKAGGGGVSGPPLIEYSATHHNDRDLITAIRSGVKQHHYRYGDMPAVPQLSDLETKLIVRYIRMLQAYNEPTDDTD